MTKTEKVLAALKNGEKLTAKQIESRFGVGNAVLLFQHFVCRGLLSMLTQQQTAMVRKRVSIVLVLLPVQLLLLAIAL